MEENLTKKLILTITTILLFLTTSIISTSAFSFFKKVEKPTPTLEEIREVYYDVFSNYKFDDGLSNLAEDFCNDRASGKDLIACDVEFMEKYKGGLCRQFSHLLMDRFEKIGLKVYFLVMTRPNAIVGHGAAVWEDKDGNKFVADPLFERALFSYRVLVNELEGYNSFSLVIPESENYKTVEKLEL